MTHLKAMLAVVLAMALTFTVQLGHAVAAPPLQTLSPQDVDLYTAAFQAADKGDFDAADQSLAKVRDPCLVGRVQYLKLVHPRARSASFADLAGWLKSFGDLPGADRIYALALKRKPAGELPPVPDAPMVSETAQGYRAGHATPQSHAARDAYYGGDVQRALGLARAGGDAWIAGLAAYRLGDYAAAMTSFETVAVNSGEEDGQRAAGAFWAARSATAAGLVDQATPFLQIAAALPDTFYGMIAARRLQLTDDPLGRVIDAATTTTGENALLLKANFGAASAGDINDLVRTDSRARRAVALMQLGRQVDAGMELRAGLGEAASEDVRKLWTGLVFALNPAAAASGRGEIVLSAPPSGPTSAYPVPPLAPTGGFVIDKALVYAITWQESRFNSLAVSPVGAIGLMQMMPPTAANMAGDDDLKSDPIPLFDPGSNLQLGQTYINWLMSRTVGYDILQTVAAYNGGPSTVNRTRQIVGPDADSLLVIESVPFAETRNYVRQVMKAYWTYRRQFGAENRTLDAAASGAGFIDARLDPSAPGEDLKPAAAPARALQAEQISLNSPG